ncbi:hypothetical protein QN277_010734 [Acacia crassicarpa]|uniref:Uncharacterized protein n=1 Tax=Acacia crassicarpa TaxID=499986 RepID=A0AAE1IQA2_9FABA|nr:hypothetical protein QN277_010734 [Acacia crassicarpa]
MVSETSLSSDSFTTRIFADVAGDITVVVDGESFLLHKFPLVSLSGKIRKMVADARGTNISHLELHNFPGGHQTFELAMKFCYGMNFEITTDNVAGLRCASEFLEMAEDFRDQNLIARTETFLNEVVFQNLQKSVEVLATCKMLPTIAEDVEITNRCVEAIAMNACKEQLVLGLSQLDCDNNESKELKDGSSIEWWAEDLSILSIDFFERVIWAMGRMGVQSDSIIACLMHYAQTSLKGIGKCQIWNPARIKPSPNIVENDQRAVVETLVSLMPADNKSCPNVPLTFLFGMLKMAIMLGASIPCRLELERRISLRILLSFLQRIEEEESEGCGGYDSDGLGSPDHGSLLKVGRLIDAYLAEIAPDPYLSLQKFIALIEILPDYARVVDDGLYRAIDIYLKAHPSLTEQECKKVCKYIDCQKLSQEASNHAAQNERLPLQMVVQVLYFEQLRLKNALSGSSGGGDGLLSQRMSSGVPSAAMSPRDNYASLRRENRELKLEISRMRVRLSELEKEQTFMKQGMMGKAGNGRTFFTSLSKGIGRIGIFSGQSGGKRQKSGKNGRSRRHSVSSSSYM